MRILHSAKMGIKMDESSKNKHVNKITFDSSIDATPSPIQSC